jgi:predicted outer membrane repeat protein
MFFQLFRSRPAGVRVRPASLLLLLLLNSILVAPFFGPPAVLGQGEAVEDGSAHEANGLLQPLNGPGTITVDTNTLSLTTAGNPNDGKCDLREALQAAFLQKSSGQPSATFNECTAAAGANTIVFSGAAAGGTITLAAGADPLPMIIKAITITGPVVISGSGQPGSPPGAEFKDSRLFRVASSGTLSLTGLTLKDAYTSGAGAAVLVDNSNGVLNLTGVSLLNNVAWGDGGAIYSAGTVNVLLSSFSGNQARGLTPAMEPSPATGHGGAVYLTGNGGLNVSLSSFSGNTAAKSGGAVYNNGAVNLSDSALSGNIAGSSGENRGGGALFNANNGKVTITRTAFSGNLAPGGSGGAFYNNLNAGAVSVSDSSFNGNISGNLTTAGRGGAIYNEEDMTIVRAAFNANMATGDGLGGAILNNRAAVLQIANSSFLANVTPDGKGGAIANIDTPFPVSADSTVDLRNVTLSNNRANTGGAIYNEEAVSLRNSIVAEGPVGSGGTCAGSKAVTNNGHNLQHPGSACGAGISSQDPKLAPPAFNGGPIASLLTQALEPDSPAIDAGNATVCSGAPVNNEDQRGKSRPNDGDGNGDAVCDIGAYEADTAKTGFGSEPVAPGPIVFGNTQVGSPVDAAFKVVETGNRALVVNGAISGANAADFAILPGVFPMTIPDGAPGQMVQLRCTPQAVGTRTAKLTLTTNDKDKLSVEYDLVCQGQPLPTPGYGSAPMPGGLLDFGDVVYLTSATTTFTVKETGTATLTISSHTITGPDAADFGLVTAVPFSLNNGDPAKSVTVVCQPSGYGPRAATLTFTTNDPTKASVSYSLACAGVPTPSPSLLAGTAATSLNSPYALAISPDGKHVYVTSSSGNHLRAGSRNSSNGTLSLPYSYSNATQQPLAVTVSPDGKNVYLTGYSSDTIAVFNRNPDSGVLSTSQIVTKGDFYLCGAFICSLDGLDGAWGVAVSPDGKNVYVVGYTDDTITVFSRNTNGQLGIIHRLKEGVNGVSGLDGPRQVVVSPDGAHVYVTSHISAVTGSIAVFSRSSADGRLSFVTSYSDGSGGFDDLAGAHGLAFSHDGGHLYVSANWDKAVTLFQRNPGNGHLTPVQTQKDGNDGVDSLYGAMGLQLSPDGTRLYVAAYFNGTLTVFDRDTLTGKLKLRDAYRDGVDGIDYLGTARALVVSPDNAHVYVTATADSAVAVFRKANPKPLLTALSPASRPQGSGGFTLTIHGANFIPGATVKWNLTNYSAQVLDSTRLTVEIPAGQLSAGNLASVTVSNPSPAAGSSNVLSFIISSPGHNPVPSIAGPNPLGTAVGSGSITVAISGANFMAGAKAYWNGAERPLTFVSGDEVRMALTAADLSVSGPAAITVVNPGPGGGSSNVASFTVVAPDQNPPPAISGISPAHTHARGAASSALVVTLTGNNFVDGAQAQWNGVGRPTTFVNSNQMRVTLLAGDLAQGGAGGIRVVNPEPGGGPSNTVTFTIFPHAIHLPLVVR